MWFLFVAKGLEDVDNKVWRYLSIRRLHVDNLSNDLRGVKKAVSYSLSHETMLWYMVRLHGITGWDGLLGTGVIVCINVHIVVNKGMLLCVPHGTIG